MHDMTELKEMLCDKLDEQRREKLTAQSLDTIHKMTDTIKNIYKIEMLEDAAYDEGYSNNYSNNYSNRRGYSRDGGSYQRRNARGQYSRDYRGGYSRGKDDMIDQMEDMMQNASDDREREAIRKAMTALRTM